MTNPTDVEFVDQVTVITEPWLDGVNDHIIGTSGVLGTNYTPTAFRIALAAALAVGDAGQTFSIAAGTAVSHAVQIGQMLSTLLGLDAGHFKIPIVENGTPRVLIIQYITGVNTGPLTAGLNHTQTINWNIPFPSVCLFALVGQSDPNLTYTAINLRLKSTTSVTVSVANPGFGTYSSTPVVFGIGY